MLLDTHIVLWLSLTPAVLPASLRERLLDPGTGLVISAANVWEIAIKFHAGKLPEAAPLLNDVPGVLASLGADFLNITPAHAIRAGALEWGHRDPFDRMLVAQALEEGIQLVTLDERITAFAGATVFSPA